MYAPHSSIRTRTSIHVISFPVYSMAQAAKAVLPRDIGGPGGQRMGVSVGGSLASMLRVNAFVTGRANVSDWKRYSLVVLNWYSLLGGLCSRTEPAPRNDDVENGGWNPQPVDATIEFQGLQVKYFP